MDPTDQSAAGKDDKGDIVTIWSEATMLFKDKGKRVDFARGAAARSMPGLREQRKKRQFCDIVFRASNGSEIWAHRFVMAARYSGCHALFALAKEGLNPEEKWLPPMRLVVEDLGSDFIQLLVDNAYHIPLHDLVVLENVRQVLELAEKLELSQLRSHCLDVLKRHLEPKSCIDTYHLASSLGYEYLAREAFRYLLRNFDQVWKNNTQFGALTPDEMRSILEDERLHAPSEVKDTFSALLQWISANKAARKGYLAKFLPLLRLGHCSVADLENVAVNRKIRGDEDSLKALNAIHQSLTSNSLAVCEVAGTDLSHRTWLKPRIPKDIIFVFGGWTEFATNSLLTYNCRSCKWRDLGYQYTPRRAYHGVVAVGHCIYVVGGFSGRDCHNSLVCLDVGQARWSAKANMAVARCYVSVAVLQGYIYAMGGYDGIYRSNTVERYDIKENYWTQVADMNDIRSDASAAVACGRIYVTGGFTGRAVLDTIEYYDPSTDLWTRVKSLPWKRSGHKMLAHNDIIYIIGGFNGTTRVPVLAQYDVKADRFSDLPSMPYAKSNFAAVLLEGCIYIIGGYNGTTVVQLVEKYDIAARKWYTAPQISDKCSAAAACVVQDVINPGKTQPFSPKKPSASSKPT
ncbi:hypothetical protein MTO96_016903 [Rhipicephalus appendiculatus]